MGDVLQFIGDWGHVAAAALFAALTVWMSRRFATQVAGKLLVAALSLTTIWLLSIAFGGVDRLESGVTESLRNCGWLVCLIVLPAQFGQSLSRHIRGAAPLYTGLALVLVAQRGLEILASVASPDSSTLTTFGDIACVLRI